MLLDKCPSEMTLAINKKYTQTERNSKLRKLTRPF
jgi:hypothetical protein